MPSARHRPAEAVMNWFLWPGEKLCDIVGLTKPDDRQGFRIFANMIVWGVVIVGIAVAVGMWTS
jgi:hypothetical protein